MVVACDEHVRVILLDIEGTTTPIAFVTDVLFPHARARVRDFLQRHLDDAGVRGDLARLQQEHAEDESAGQAPPPWRADLDSVVAYVRFLMDRDRKSTGLKSLQGRIWEEGFRAGALRGAVYPDVPDAFERWRGQGRAIAIFSSGSVLAQKLLFGTAAERALTADIAAYFDTTVGPKREAGSYRRIANTLSVTPRQVLFVSDVAEELDAAREAGMRTALCVREGKPGGDVTHSVVTALDAVCP